MPLVSACSVTFTPTSGSRLTTTFDFSAGGVADVDGGIKSVEFWIDAGLRELARVEVPGTPRKILATGLDLETRNLGDLSDVE